MNTQGQQWYCVRSQVKRERVAAANLALIEGVEVLAPRIKYKKITKRGKVWWSEAMFPGYVFARFDRYEHERVVMHAMGVLCLVRFGQTIPVIAESFIEELKSTLPEGGEGEVIIEPLLKEGDHAEITNGVLTGHSGEVVSVLPAQERVRLLIEMMGEKQVVEVDLYSLLLAKV